MFLKKNKKIEQRGFEVRVPKPNWWGQALAHTKSLSMVLRQHHSLTSISVQLQGQQGQFALCERVSIKGGSSWVKVRYLTWTMMSWPRKKDKKVRKGADAEGRVGCVGHPLSDARTVRHSCYYVHLQRCFHLFFTLLFLSKTLIVFLAIRVCVLENFWFHNFASKKFDLWV